MRDLVIGILLGAAGSALIVFGLVWLRLRTVRSRLVVELARRDSDLVELRQELADDKETNRRLRRDLAMQTPERLTEIASTAQANHEVAVRERDQAVERSQRVQRELDTTKARLSQQESKLRHYREALQEIRLTLEAQGRWSSVPPPGITTEELFATDAPAEEVVEANSPAEAAADLSIGD